MDLTSILEYQNIDKALYNLEQTLENGVWKNMLPKLNQTAKNSQNKSSQLEGQAAAVLKEMEELKKTIDATKKHGKDILKSDPETMSSEQIEQALLKKDRVTSNLIALDKRLTRLAENINQILAEFNSTVKIYNDAKLQYQQIKAKQDRELAEAQPKINELKAKLDLLSKKIDPKTLEFYKARRADKIFPVFVELIGNSCGRCRMELSASALSKLKSEQTLTCENCRRVIYYKK